MLTPLLWAGVYLLVFGVVLSTNRGVDNFAGFLVIGVFLYHFSASSIQQGSKAITGNRDLIGSLQFPRALLPMATVLAELVTLLPALVVLLVLVPLTGEPVQASWLLLVPAVALQWLFGTGVAFLLARAVSEVRDLARLVPFALRVLIYTSGVFFSINHYVDNPTAVAVLEHQPIAIYLELGRAALLSGVHTGVDTWLWGIGWAVAAALGGLRVLLACGGEVRPWLTGPRSSSTTSTSTTGPTEDGGPTGRRRGAVRASTSVRSTS